MAEKSLRIKIGLVCSVCHRQNYVTERKREVGGELKLKKHCPKCRKHTLHKERKKL